MKNTCSACDASPVPNASVVVYFTFQSTQRGDGVFVGPLRFGSGRVGFARGRLTVDKHVNCRPLRLPYPPATNPLSSNSPPKLCITNVKYALSEELRLNDNIAKMAVSRSNVCGTPLRIAGGRWRISCAFPSPSMQLGPQTSIVLTLVRT